MYEHSSLLLPRSMVPHATRNERKLARIEYKMIAEAVNLRKMFDKMSCWGGMAESSESYRVRVGMRAPRG